jgi:hypothetical protein
MNIGLLRLRIALAYIMDPKPYGGASSRAESTSAGSTPLCQNCVKTPSVWGVGSCYLSESSFPKLLITGTSV